MRDPIAVICVAGPTGSGKSSLAARLGAEYGGSVINIDSRQVYRDFPLITAQPDQEERSLCPHELYGFCATDRKISAGSYARLTADTLERVSASGRIPILTGGTGLYIDALLKGLPEMPDVPAEISTRWRQRLAAEGAESLHAILREVDPDLASRLHPRDSQRICRGLEIHAATNIPLSVWQKRPVPPSPYRILWLYVGLALNELGPRLEARIRSMVANGAVEEARQGRGICDDPNAPGWTGIGCAELYRHLTGELSLEEAIDLWTRNTRAYAKRQITWFRRGDWLRLRPEDGELAADRVKDWLGG